MKIVVIEDDEAIGFSLRLALEDRGHDVEIYTNPLEVPFDDVQAEVILLDYYMPQLNGGEVAQRLRDAGVKARIILMSASPQLLQVAESLEIEHMAKPFDLSTLFQHIEAKA
jgi:two-component system, OmpR family, response regulator